MPGKKIKMVYTQRNWPRKYIARKTKPDLYQPFVRPIFSGRVQAKCLASHFDSPTLRS